eukprot:TRINITY_DN5599_c0_g4_i1.p1 TRINITY_DN5599_c0_g4~~TRINITY_DN5599_c0_g4_i1.p1  ORF type:complete len:663 (-),score=77.74 TRINITY_DN5599_c0_g4_i1:86-2011(-)
MAFGAISMYTIMAVLLHWMYMRGICYRNSRNNASMRRASTNASEAHERIRFLEIFEPFDLELRHCDIKPEVGNLVWLPHSVDIENLPRNLGWLLQWDKLMEVTDDNKQIELEYAFVAGDQIPVPYPRGLIGWCYRLTAESPEAQNSAICVCGKAAKRKDEKEYARDLDHNVWRQTFNGCTAQSTLCEFRSSGSSSSSSSSQMDFDTGVIGVKESGFQVRWQHPRTLLIDMNDSKNRRCYCKAERVNAPQRLDNSLAHGMSYCVVEEYVRKVNSVESLSTQDITDYLVWAACFDQEHSRGWFRADTARYVMLWSSVCDELGGYFGDRPMPARDRHLEVPWKVMCTSMRKDNPSLYHHLQRSYEAYTKGQVIMPRDSAEPPTIIFASGPPGSGKSLSSLSADLPLIQKATGALKHMNSTYFQNNIMEGANVDRMVEKTDLLYSSKAYLKTKKAWLSSNPSDESQASSFQTFEEDISQKEYWYLRKNAHVEDLANAHLQRLLGCQQDLIYETTLTSTDWLVTFELPKIKAARYKSLLVNLVVPLDDLVVRLSQRAAEKGQTPASRNQLEHDVKASPTNFMKYSLLSAVDYAVAFSHVKGNSEGSETIFVAYADGCFKECADYGALTRFDVLMMGTCELGKCPDC